MKRVLSVIMAVIILGLIIPVNASEVTDAYTNSVLKSREYFSPYVYYTVYDIDRNGIDELILDKGGSDGAQVFCYIDGNVYMYNGVMGCNATFYAYNNKLYTINSNICGGDQYYGEFMYWLSEVQLTNNCVTEIELWNGIISETFENMNREDYNANEKLCEMSYEIAQIIRNGKMLNFYSMNDYDGFDDGKIKVKLNGTKIEFDQSPVMVSDRVIVPIRAIFEAMGYNVDWNESVQTATAIKGNNKIIVQINNNVIYYVLNNMSGSYICDVPPQELSGRILVPVRAVAECAGCDVEWDDILETVYIEY